MADPGGGGPALYGEQACGDPDPPIMGTVAGFRGLEASFYVIGATVFVLSGATALYARKTGTG